jgi:hypothetical protein
MSAEPTFKHARREGIKPSTNVMAENDGIASNGVMSACLWQGNSVAVVPCYTYDRLEHDVRKIHHGLHVTDFAFSPFHS